MSEKSSSPEKEPIPEPILEPEPLLEGFEEPFSPSATDPWKTIPTTHPPLVKSGKMPTITPSTISSLLPTPSKLPDDSKFITVPDKTNAVEVTFVLETVDKSETVVNYEILEKNNSEENFYRNVNNIMKKLHDTNKDLDLIHGYVIYRVQPYSTYFTMMKLFHYKQFWKTKLAKDHLLITNHIYGNKHPYMTLDMKDAIKGD